jgi:SAM-dependent methyltransferase
MADSVTQFYDDLSADFHLLLEDWPKSVRWQGEVLDRLIREQLGAASLAVLDCCCGIGTQAIGLALHGHRVQGTDISTAAVQRGVREAASFGVSVPFAVADVRTLADQVAGSFDVVLACDNALPHLLTDEDLVRGVRGMAAKLRPGGLFLASIRDYDAFVRERAPLTPARLLSGPPCRRVIFQVWDWAPDGHSYRVQQFIVRETEAGWQTAYFATDYRALLRAEMDHALRQAELDEIRWHMPQESAYYQPIVTARKRA